MGFKFENLWLQHHSFLESVKGWWDECLVPGWEGYKFMKKLKHVKEKLKVWNVDVFGDIKVRKKVFLQKLEVLDKLESEGG